MEISLHIKPPKHFIKVITTILLMLSTATAGAEGFFIGVDAIRITPVNNRFTEDDKSSVYFGYKKPWGLLNFGVIPEHRFDLEDADGTFINSEANFITAAYVLHFKKVDFEIGAGIYNWDAEAFLNNRKVGSSNDNSGFIDLSMVIDIVTVSEKKDKVNSQLGAKLNWKQVNDVAGDDLDIISIGIQYQF